MSRAASNAGEGGISDAWANRNAIIAGANISTGYGNTRGVAKMNAVGIWALSRGNYFDVIELNSSGISDMEVKIFGIKGSNSANSSICHPLELHRLQRDIFQFKIISNRKKVK